MSDAFGVLVGLPMPQKSSMTLDAVLQQVENVDQKHEDGHRRLRETLVEQAERLEGNYQYFRERVELLSAKATLLEQDVTNLRVAPLNLDKLLFTPKIVASVVITVLTMGAFFWATSGSVKSDIRDILTRMDAAQKIAEARSTNEDLQLSTLRSAVDELKRQQSLQAYEIQDVKAIVTRKQLQH